MRLLSPADWQAERREHEERAGRLAAAYRDRRSRRADHAVDDFLWTYYSLRPGRLARWSPGVGVGLVVADPADGAPDPPPGLRAADGGAVLEGAVLEGAVLEGAVLEGAVLEGAVLEVDVEAFTDRARGVLEWTTTVLAGVASRPARHDCFGLHEWAMVYRADDRRHALPLRLGAAATDAVVERAQLRCSHIDAYRFFTEAAAPRNSVRPTRERQPELDHAGCVHVTMDLLKWALKLGPLVPGGLLLDCFELARDARRLDMAASPYDVQGYGLAPVPVETPAGRARYAAAQRDLAVRAAPLRERLLAVCRAAAAVPTRRG